MRIVYLRRPHISASLLAELRAIEQAGAFQIFNLGLGAQAMRGKIGLRVGKNVRILFMVTLQMRMAAGVLGSQSLVVIRHDAHLMSQRDSPSTSSAGDRNRPLVSRPSWSGCGGDMNLPVTGCWGGYGSMSGS